MTPHPARSITAQPKVWQWLNDAFEVHNSTLTADYSPRRPANAVVNLDAGAYAVVTDDDGTWTIAICGQSSAGAYNGPILHEATVAHDDPMARAYLTAAHLIAARDLHFTLGQ